MEHPSFQKLLVSIPSRATSLAMACVGQMLEDQIQDAQNIAKNLKRIGSVVSEWGLVFSAEIDETGDTGKQIFGPKWGKVQKLNTTLINLPSKIRLKIWEFLSNKDLLNLRQVCSKVQFDVDNGVGLRVIMDTSCESITWLHRITTRECYVKTLDNFLYFNFLPKPERMEILQLHPYITVFPDMLELVLRKFTFLRKLEFYSQEIFDVSNGKEIKSICPSVTTKLLSVLDNKERINGIFLQFNEVSSTMKWNLQLEAQGNAIGFQKINLKIPFSQFNQQNDCLQYLKCQNDISYLQSDLTGIAWEQYKKIIQENRKSLSSLSLINVSSTGSPFNCSILNDCSNLRLLSISGEINNDGFSYLPMVELRELLLLRKLHAIKLKNIYISTEDYSFLKNELSKIIWMEECLCGDEKIAETKFGFEHLQNLWAERSYSAKIREDWDTEDESDFNDTELINNDLEGNEDESIEIPAHDYYYGFDKSSEVNCSNSLIFSGFADRIPVEILKGVLVTAWIFLC